MYWVSSRRGPQFKSVGIGADEDVSVVWATTAIIDAKRVLDGDGAAGGSTEGGLGCDRVEEEG